MHRYINVHITLSPPHKKLQDISDIVLGGAIPRLCGHFMDQRSGAGHQVGFVVRSIGGGGDDDVTWLRVSHAAGCLLVYGGLTVVGLVDLCEVVSVGVLAAGRDDFTCEEGIELINVHRKLLQITRISYESVEYLLKENKGRI